MDTLCITCLCSGRKMICLTDSELLNVYTQILNEPALDIFPMCSDMKVCWECSAVMRRFQKFKLQAHCCYRELLDQLQQNSSKDLKRVPHLQIHHAHNISVEHFDVIDTVKIEDTKVVYDDISQEDDIQNDLQNGDDTHNVDDIEGDHIHEVNEADNKDNVHNEMETFVADIILDSKVKKKRKKVKLKKKTQNGELKMTKHKAKVKKVTAKKTEDTDADKQDLLASKENDLKLGLKDLDLQSKEPVQNGGKSVRSRELLPEKPQCAECGKMFSSRKTYRYHMNVLHKGQNSYPCPRCGKVYQWKSNLGRHMRTHRARDNDELHCTTCDKKFASLATFRQHLISSRRHVNETDYSFMCNECGKKFVNKTRLRDHIDWEHLNKIKFRCQVCNKPFKCHTSRYVHMQNVHANKEKKNLCHVCGKSYTNAAKLRYHIVAMHTSETPYRCERCDAAFSWYSSLYRHIREVHYKMKVHPKKSKKSKKQAEEMLPHAHPPVNLIPNLTP